MNRFIIFALIFTQSFSLSSLAANHHPQDLLKKISGSKEEGAQIVHHYCATCHALKPIIPIGAPRIGQLKDWEPRLNLGLQSLFDHTTQGLNAMPARGGCFECSDKQLMLAIVELLPESAHKSILNDPLFIKNNR